MKPIFSPHSPACRQRWRRLTLALLASALLCLSCLLLAGCARQNHDADEDPDASLPQIIIGSDIYPPYNYLNGDGTPNGIDVKIATEAFRRMGYRAVFRTIDWESKKDLVESGEIDCIWGSFSMAGREDQYRWAGPYMFSRQVVAVNRNSSIYHLSDLEDKVVAVQTTTKSEEIFLQETDPRIPAVREVLSTENRNLVYAALGKGYADAIAMHEVAILQYNATFGTDFRILEEELLHTGLGVAFAKNDTRGLDTKLSATLTEMREDGTLEAILSQYLPNAAAYLEVESLEK